MNEDTSKKIIEYEKELEKIISREIPLRDPSITVLKVPIQNVKEVYLEHQLILRRLKTKYPEWTYKLVNIEAVFFDILKKLRFLEKNTTVKTAERSRFRDNLKGTVLTEVINAIEEEIKSMKSQKTTKNPSFLVIQNMHATYPYIETKDLISRIINEKGIYIIILYLVNPVHNPDEEPYKPANYMVHSFALY